MHIFPLMLSRRCIYCVILRFNEFLVGVVMDIRYQFNNCGRLMWEMKIVDFKNEFTMNHITVHIVFDQWFQQTLSVFNTLQLCQMNRGVFANFLNVILSLLEYAVIRK